MTQPRRRVQRAGAAQARVSGQPNDPRVQRNARSAGMTDVVLGAGLKYDRQGKLTVAAGPSVPRLPESPTLEDLIAHQRALDRSLRTAGLIPE